MNLTHKYFTPPHLIFTLLLALSVSTGCQVESDDSGNSEPAAKISYTVKFDTNGGEGKLPGDITATVGEEFTLPAAKLTKTGYDFKGWCATADGTGTTYETGAKAKDLSKENGATVTLYAKWVLLGNWSINYVLNGGTNADENPESYNVETETITLKPAVKSGYIFDGWYKEDSFATQVPKITKGSTGNITLYAKWTKTYTITFDSNGGTGEMNPQTAESGTEITLPTSAFTKDGNIFAGWATSADGDVSYSDKAKITLTGNITLYAKYGMTAANAAAAIANLIEEGTHTVTVAGEITSDDLTKLANAISGRAKNVKVILDLGGATGLTEIPEDFMSNQDESLAGLVIPASVTEIKSNFWSCSNLSVLKVAENNPAYKSVGNIIYTKDGQTLVLAARALTEATISASVVTIGTGAFQTCEKLQKVTFEQGSLLETIEDYAFGDCNELTEITLPSTLRTLGEEVFNCCFELKSITLPEGIKTIPARTFLNCTSLAEISLPSTLESIGKLAFYNMGLSTVKYNGTKSDWDNIQKGNRNNNLDNAALVCLGSDPKEVYAPADKAATVIAGLEGGTKANRNICTVKITSKEESDKDFLKEIGEKIESRYAEYVCINLDLSATSITEIPEKAFYGVSLLEITLPDSLDTIRMKAFKDDYKLKKIVIPDNVRIIEAEAFNGCLYLAEITLPASLTNIGEYAFDDCVSLKTVKYGGTQDDWNTKIELGDGAFTSGTKINCSDGNVVTIE